MSFFMKQLHLHQAVLKSDVNRVKKLLRSGCDVNYYRKDEFDISCTYLHLATDSIITRELLLHGAIIDTLNGNGFTPLEYAIIKRKDLAVIMELLQFGAISTGLLHAIMMSAASSKDCVILYKLINLFDTKRLTNYFLECEQLLIHRIYIYTNIEFYNMAFYFFLERMNPIWMMEIWSFMDADDEYLEEDLEEFVMFRKNEDFIRYCIEEVKNLRLYKFGELKITDIIKLPIYKRTPLRYFNRKKYSEILNRFPIYGYNVVTRMEELNKRKYLMKKLDNLTLTSENKDTGENVIWNIDCMEEISRYLNNEELKNFTEALEGLNFFINSVVIYSIFFFVFIV